MLPGMFYGGGVGVTNRKMCVYIVFYLVLMYPLCLGHRNGCVEVWGVSLRFSCTLVDVVPGT